MPGLASVLDVAGRLRWDVWRTRGRELAVHPRARQAAGVVALAVVYRGAAEIGYTLQFAGPVASVVWLPVGAGWRSCTWAAWGCGLGY